MTALVSRVCGHVMVKKTEIKRCLTFLCDVWFDKRSEIPKIFHSGLPHACPGCYERHDYSNLLLLMNVGVST